MINIEIATLNVVQYSRAANAQTFKKLPDGSLPGEAEL
jgi:hypothetical protein